MPCRGQCGAEEEYMEVLDEIGEIIQKLHSSDILVAGDMNASIVKDNPNSRDRKLLDFIEEYRLFKPDNFKKTNTYFHHSGNASTQIDYILGSSKDFIQNYFTIQREPTNTSTHDPVVAIVPILLAWEQPISANGNIVVEKVRWGKLDKAQYQHVVAENYQT